MLRPDVAAPRTPLVAADVIVELEDASARPIVLVRRRNPPLGWALPGGFVEVGETVLGAARREAREETALDVRLRALLGVYSAPDRDPRGHCVSVVFVAGARGAPSAGDDAAEVRVCAPDRPPADLAFDHARILADYRRFRSEGRLPAPG